MDKQPVGTLPDLTASSLDDEIMVITDSEHNQLKKEKISDFITDLTSTDENNAIVKGTDGKMFVTDFGNASNITEGTLPTSVLPEIPLEKIPDIPKDKLPSIETSDLPVSGVTADTYAYPSSVTVNAQGQVTAIEEGEPGANNANQDLSNLSPEGEKHFLNKTQITNCILEAPNGVAEWSGVTLTGSLTNNQGVVSGFSASNYLTINKTPPAETMKITSFELYGTSSVTVVAAHSMIYGQLKDNYSTPQLGWSQSGNPGVSVSDDGSTWTTAQITSADGFVAEANQTYNMLVTWDSTSKTLTFKIKKDTDATYTFTKTTTLDSVNWTGLMAIGIDEIDTGEFFRGTIDLSQSYIKINGKIWWQGNDLGFNQFRVKEGLKTLIPNGRNEDGTLRNIEFTVDSDFIYAQTSQNTYFYLLLIKEETTKKAYVAVKARFMQGLSYQMPVTVETIYPYYYYATDENFYYYTTGSTTADWKPLYASVIGEGESTNGNIISFVPYNPVNLAKEQDIDGMWVGSFYNVFSDVSFTAGQKRTYSLSDYLPKDGNIYEVICSGKATTGATAGDTAYMQLETSVFPNTSSFVACQTPSNRSMFVCASTTVPVGADRNITISNASAEDTATLQLRLNGYRKVR